jgi:hypothetical protein
MSMNDVNTALHRQIRSNAFSNLRSKTAAAQQCSNRQDKACKQNEVMIQLRQQVQRCAAAAVMWFQVVCWSLLLHVASMPLSPLLLLTGTTGPSKPRLQLCH